jgi:hypothetical protein
MNKYFIVGGAGFCQYFNHGIQKLRELFKIGEF